ncbi:MAG TPA: hypothetical protein VKU82_15715, partial [Planctomycetaceae bacterium]|nr:hypothetical protein [Planctomycetaceae bacterium]
MFRAGPWLIASLAVAILALDASRNARAPAAQEGSTEGYGSITGQFVLEGEIPSFKPLVALGNMTVNDAAICTAADVPDESLVVDAASKGIANVFVYLPKAEKVHPRMKESAAKEVPFDQK